MNVKKPDSRPLKPVNINKIKGWIILKNWMKKRVKCELKNQMSNY